jgi:dienelactone hydrolase
MRVAIHALVCTLLWTIISYANVLTKSVDYSHGNTNCRGFLAYDSRLRAKHPGVIVVHESWGLNGFIKEKTRELAAQGYVAFAVDLFGEGRTAATPREAARLTREVQTANLMRKRIQAGLAVLKGHPRVRQSKIAAVGFCLGAEGVLELAFSGADIAGAVAFQGPVSVPPSNELQNMRARLLILHGADDPHTKERRLRRLREVLSRSDCDWQMVLYGNAAHGFSNPKAGTYNREGTAYNPRVAQRSWRHTRRFLQDIFQSNYQRRGSEGNSKNGLSAALGDSF